MSSYTGRGPGPGGSRGSRGPQGGQGSPRGDSVSDDILEWLLGLLLLIAAAAGAVHLAVLTAGGLSGRDPQIGFGDTMRAVVGSPGNPVAGYPATVGELPPVWLVWLLTIVFIGIPVAGVVWWKLRRAGQRTEQGLETPVRLRRQLGAAAAIQAARRNRPSLAGEKHLDADAAATFLGTDHSGRHELYSQAEDSEATVAPPRSGKTTNIAVGRILDAAGPVIATSTKADLVQLTALRRAEVGDVHVFDPLDITGWPDQLHWSPVTGCQDPEEALARAEAFVAARPLDADAKNTGFFSEGAGTVLRCMLHAAALTGKTMEDVVRWGAEFDTDEPFEILRADARAPAGWAAELRTFTKGAPETVSSTRMTLGLILKPLASPRVLRTVCPQEWERPFDVHRFLQSKDTLYLLSDSHGASVAPLLTAFADYVVRAAKRSSQRYPDRRLDPPLGLVLDEAPNVAPLPNMVGLMSDSGGRGITVSFFAQSFAQMRRRWGRDEAAAIWGAATVKFVLGGLGEADDLEALSRLCGDRKVSRYSHTRGRDHQSVQHSLERERVMPLERIRDLPVGQALMFYRNLQPAVIRLRPWWKRHDQAAIAAAEKRAAAKVGQP